MELLTSFQLKKRVRKYGLLYKFDNNRTPCHGLSTARLKMFRKPDYEIKTATKINL